MIKAYLVLIFLPILIIICSVVIYRISKPNEDTHHECV